MVTLVPSVAAELERSLLHARDGVRRIQNASSDRESRVTATNVITTLARLLRIVRGTVSGAETLSDEQDGHDVGA